MEVLNEQGHTGGKSVPVELPEEDCHLAAQSPDLWERVLAGALGTQVDAVPLALRFSHPEESHQPGLTEPAGVFPQGPSAGPPASPGGTMRTSGGFGIWRGGEGAGRSHAVVA